jgi:hypothetical protein
VSYWGTKYAKIARYTHGLLDTVEPLVGSVGTCPCSRLLGQMASHKFICPRCPLIGPLIGHLPKTWIAR